MSLSALELDSKFYQRMVRTVRSYQKLNLKLLPIGRMSLLQEGHEFATRLLYELENAKTHIWISTYYIDTTMGGDLFLEKLIEASLRGVSVVFLLERLNSELNQAKLKQLENSGAILLSRNFNRYLEFFVSLFNREFYKRDHQKVYLIDNKVFVGSANIGDDYFGPQMGNGFFSDLTFFGENVFLSDSINMMIRMIENCLSLPQVVRKSSMVEKIKKNYFSYLRLYSEDYTMNNIRFLLTFQPSVLEIQEAMFEAIRNAKHSIKIINPYYYKISDFEIELISAHRRGVKVEILTGRKRDVPVYKHFNSGVFFEALVRDGIPVYDHTSPKYLHTKAMMVDENLVQVGSYNLDHYSYYINTEVNVEIVGDRKIISDFNSYWDLLMKDTEKIDINKRPYLPFKKKLKRCFYKAFLYVTNEMFLYNIYKQHFPEDEIGVGNDPIKSPRTRLFDDLQLRDWNKKFEYANLVRQWERTKKDPLYGSKFEPFSPIPGGDDLGDEASDA